MKKRFKKREDNPFSFWSWLVPIARLIGFNKPPKICYSANTYCNAKHIPYSRKNRGEISRKETQEPLAPISFSRACHYSRSRT